MSLRSIGGDDLARFHEARGVKDISCSRCGTSNWQIESVDVVPASAIPELTADGTVRAPGFKTLILGCKNCANLWLMAYEPIAEWLEEHPA